MGSSLPPLRVPFYPVSREFPRLHYGLSPLDKGFLTNISEENAEEMRRTDPIASKCLRPLASNNSLLNSNLLWCLWLEGVSEETIHSSPELTRRTNAVREFRSKSLAKKTYEWKDSTEPIGAELQPKREYLAIPTSFSDTYEYLPVVRLSSEVISNQTLGIIEEEEFFVAGILSSRIFYLWKKTALSRFAQSNKISTYALYQTIPVPQMQAAVKEEIEHNFDRVLRVRANFARNTLAELYAPNFKPDQLRTAHRRLSSAVYVPYRFTLDTPEDEICERLFALHQQLSPLG